MAEVWPVLVNTSLYGENLPLNNMVIFRILDVTLSMWPQWKTVGVKYSLLDYMSLGDVGYTSTPFTGLREQALLWLHAKAPCQKCCSNVAYWMTEHCLHLAFHPEKLVSEGHRERAAVSEPQRQCQLLFLMKVPSLHKWCVHDYGGMTRIAAVICPTFIIPPSIMRR